MKKTNASLQHRLWDPEFKASHRVRWIETDTSGTVHFANYVRMMEETEYKFLRSRGLNIVMSDRLGRIGFPRISSEIHVVRPAVFNELLTIWIKVDLNDGLQLVYQFEIADEGGHLVARGRFKVVCCRFSDGEMPRAILIPDFFLEKIPETS